MRGSFDPLLAVLGVTVVLGAFGWFLTRHDVIWATDMSPTVVERCVEDATVPSLEPNYGGGVPMGSGMQMVFRQRCVRWEKVCVLGRQRVDVGRCLP